MAWHGITLHGMKLRCVMCIPLPCHAGDSRRAGCRVWSKPLTLNFACPPAARSDMLVAYNALLHFLGTAGELQRALKVYQVRCCGGFCCGGWAPGPGMHGGKAS